MNYAQQAALRFNICDANREQAYGQDLPYAALEALVDDLIHAPDDLIRGVLKDFIFDTYESLSDQMSDEVRNMKSEIKEAKDEIYEAKLSIASAEGETEKAEVESRVWENEVYNALRTIEECVRSNPEDADMDDIYLRSIIGKVDTILRDVSTLVLKLQSK